MRYSGNGSAIQLTSPQGYNLTVNQRAEKFELPSQLNIGAGYDWDIVDNHRLTFLGNFTSNAFTKDYIGGGLEYGFRERFMLRAGYRYEQGINTETFDPEERSSAYTGLSAGATISVPLGKEAPAWALITATAPPIPTTARTPWAFA